MSATRKLSILDQALRESGSVQLMSLFIRIKVTILDQVLREEGRLQLMLLFCTIKVSMLDQALREEGRIPLMSLLCTLKVDILVQALRESGSDQLRALAATLKTDILVQVLRESGSVQLIWFPIVENVSRKTSRLNDVGKVPLKLLNGSWISVTFVPSVETPNHVETSVSVSHQPVLFHPLPLVLSYKSRRA